MYNATNDLFMFQLIFLSNWLSLYSTFLDRKHIYYFVIKEKSFLFRKRYQFFGKWMNDDTFILSNVIPDLLLKFSIIIFFFDFTIKKNSPSYFWFGIFLSMELFEWSLFNLILISFISFSTCSLFIIKFLRVHKCHLCMVPFLFSTYISDSSYIHSTKTARIRNISMIQQILQSQCSPSTN